MLQGPSDDDDLERPMLGRSPRFQALLNRSRQSVMEGKDLSEQALGEAVRKRAQERKAIAMPYTMQDFRLDFLKEHFTPEQRLEGLTLEERLKGLSPEEVDDYLQRRKQEATKRKRKKSSK